MFLNIVILSLLCGLAESQELNTNLTLPWGTWQASLVSSSSEIYKFQNVRFGGVPIRFGNSSTPAPIADNSTLQDSSYGPSCYQVDITALKNPPGGRPNLGSPITVPPPNMDQSEDCLFLDIYVPASALQPNAPKLPVVVWFYGGAYAFGSKLQFGPDYPEFYSGQGLIEQSNNQMIFVAGNYRLGALGWLAGSYMETKGIGLPNAGLYDQRLLLRWVQDWIDQVGGDTSKVSAWGESAGAGSIMHHLIQNGGQTDPLFSKALLQSPAFEWQWDRSGTLDGIYQTFSNLSNCGYTHDIDCLRSANISDLVVANQELFANVKQTGLFPVGPSVDGKWVNDLPAVQFSQGAYWKQLDSILVSHVGNESGSFIPYKVVSNSTFQTFLNAFMPEEDLSDIKAAIMTKYDCTKPPYNGDYRLCVSILIRDSTFTCNTRQLYDAYVGKAYMMQYDFPSPILGTSPALHATDLLPTFINAGTDITALLKYFKVKYAPLVEPFIKKLQANYKKYLASYAVFGDPNQAKNPANPTWPLASGTGNEILDVLEVKGGVKFFDVISDGINTQQSCTFWTEVARNISKIMAMKQASMASLLVEQPEL